MAKATCGSVAAFGLPFQGAGRAHLRSPQQSCNIPPMRTCSFRLQIASAAAMAVALTICSSPHADEPTDFYQALGRAFEWPLKDPEFRAEADRLALEIDLVTGETLQDMVERHVWLPRARWSRWRAGDWPMVRGRHAAIYSRRGRRRGRQHRI